jgi:Zn-dependent protease with chaperone function
VTAEPDVRQVTDESTAGGGPPAETRLRAALSGSSILPSDTSIRYATLVGMVFATTIVIYLRLWLDRLDSEDAYRACAAGLSGLAPSLLLPGSSPEAMAPFVAIWLRCGKPYAGTALIWALAGVLAVAGVAAVAYLAMPWWRIRRRRLRPLDRVHFADLHAHLNYLVERMGLASRPTFWLAPQASAQGLAFGRQGRCHVQLNAGLVKKWRTDRPVVTAVALHELAHVRNRDIRYTYLAITTWWAFVLVALFPYVLTSVLPLILGGYPGWWPAQIRGSSVNGRVVMSVLVMSALAYLMYTAILRTREMHADTTAISLAGKVDASDAALRRVLERSLPQDKVTTGFWRDTGRLWRVLRKHPSVQRRLAILDDPTPLYSASVPAMVGAGIAVAVVQVNLVGLAAQAAIVLTPAGRPAVSLAGYLAAFLVPFVVSVALIAALGYVTMWRARLRTYPDFPARRGAWLGPAAAFGAGLLIGEPLSVYFGTQNVWGVFDGIGVGGAGVAGVVGAMVSAAALVFGIGVLFAWMSECAAVWIPVTRGSLRQVGLVASLVGVLAFGPAYVAWFWLHDSGFILTKLSLFDGPPSWVSSWRPPGMSIIYSEYLPIFLVCAVPGIGVALALPWLFVVAGAMRRPPPETPRWLRSAGPAADGLPPPQRPRIPVGAAMRTGIAGAVACLAAALILAGVVWHRTGGRAGPDIANAGIYLTFATIMLAVVFSAVSAGIVAARARHAGGTLALLAAFITSGVVAITTAFVATVGICGPVDVLAKAGCRSATAAYASVGYGAAMFLGVPRAVIAACLAGAVTAAISSLVQGLRRDDKAAKPDPEHLADPSPSKLRRVILVTLTGAIIANLIIGGYIGYGILLSG